MNRTECIPFVIEDDDGFAMLLGRAFRKAGVPDGNVRRFRDGEAVLSALGTIGVPRPSVLTLDLELPGMSGLSVLKDIRSHEQFQDLPAFFLSGREDPLQVAEAYALGAGGYWVKPQTLWELQEIVQTIMDSYWRRGQRPLPGCLPNPRMRYPGPTGGRGRTDPVPPGRSGVEFNGLLWTAKMTGTTNTRRMPHKNH